eukprot:TRINITY_DN11099_c0_g1_i1.p1 TRINITY_DN11099_c0_g1~~TRINITY_DN11099_c0_g1_i1.p1  ORF type:complete len:140 (+),score=23.53 TRINITY_DN11099_c0_g1_i1:60-422(+)
MSWFRERARGYFVENMTTVEESTLLASDLLRKEIQYAAMRKSMTDEFIKQGKWLKSSPLVSDRQMDRMGGMHINPWKSMLLMKNGLVINNTSELIAADVETTWTKQRAREGKERFTFRQS